MDLKICRICLNKTGSISVFDTEDNVQHSTRIMRCVNVVIAIDDGLPTQICDSCFFDLSVSYSFVQKCEASDLALRCLGNIQTPTSIQENLQIELENLKQEDFKNEDLYEVKNEIEDQHDYDSGFLLVKSKKCRLPDDKKKVQKRKSVRKKVQKRKSVRKKAKTKTGPIQCVICGLVAISRSSMEIHMRTHTGEKPYACLSCDTKFPTKGALKRHSATYHTERERKFTCEMCGNSFYTKSDIITHMRIHTDEKPYSCPFCSMSFRQIASLIRHKRTHTGEKPYSCPICEKRFSDRSLVTKHLSVHSADKNFSCHVCSKSVKSRTALNSHMILHSNEKRNICSFCGMAFAMKGNLQTHVRRVHSEKSGQCSICVKTFSNLDEHMRSHTGEKPFECALCKKAFARKCSLTYHMAFKHENAAKFKCSIGDCLKTFPIAAMLEFHLLKQHTNHTPFVCQHCARGFYRTSDLSRHLKVSHMEVQLKIPMKHLVS